MVSCSLLDTLSRAHEFKELRDESPLVTVSLHRLLLAVLHRAFDGPKTPVAWKQLWQDGIGKFDRTKLEAYLKHPELFPRFDLFDTQHPFYQTAALPLGAERQKNKKTNDKYWYSYAQPIWHLAHELKYSDSMNLFSHYTEAHCELRSAAAAVRWLVAFQAFALGGTITTEEGKKQVDGQADAGLLVKSAVVLAKGDNLFQTLMLNLHHYSVEDEMPFKFNAIKDTPAWERDDPVKPADRTFDGYLDLLTWQSRHVKLVPELNSNGELVGVSGVVAMKGWQLPGFDRFDRETMVGFVKAEKAKPKDDPWPPLGFRVGRELWRDCHTLFQSVSDRSERPKVLKWIDDLRQEGYLDLKQVQLDSFGMSASQAKIFFWRHETLPLPLDYLSDVNLLGSLRQAIHLADRVAHVLSRAVWLAVAADQKPTKETRRLTRREREAIDEVMKSLRPETTYWSGLEQPFRLLLENLPGDEPHRSQQVQEWYSRTLEPTARAAFRQTAGEMEHSSRALRAAVSGEAALKRGLTRIIADNTFLTPSHQQETVHAGS